MQRSDLYALLDLDPQTRGDQTKLRVIEATIESIASEGLDGVTFKSIADRLHTSRAHVHYHFADKADAVLAATRYSYFAAQSFTVQRLRGAAHWRDQLAAMVDGAFDWAEAHPEQLSVLQAFFHGAGVHHKFNVLYDEVRKLGMSRITQILQHGLGESSAPGTSDLPSIAETIQSVIYGIMFHMRARSNSSNIHSYRRQAHLAVAGVIACALAQIAPLQTYLLPTQKT